MPLFDFTCTACDRVFERLVRGESRVACPACGSTKVERMVPVPARPVGRNEGGAVDVSKFGPPPGGGCCGGGCAH